MAGSNESVQNNVIEEDVETSLRNLRPIILPSAIHPAVNGTGEMNGSCKYDTNCLQSHRPFNEKECRDLAEEFVTRFGRGFSKGVCVYAGLHIGKALLRNPFRKR